MCIGFERCHPRDEAKLVEHIQHFPVGGGADGSDYIPGPCRHGDHDETKWAPLTTEFWAMLILIIAILIAAAVSDSLDDIRAWTLVTIISAAYIVSRGLAKGGTDHTPFLRRGRRRT